MNRKNSYTNKHGVTFSFGDLIEFNIVGVQRNFGRITDFDTQEYPYHYIRAWVGALSVGDIDELELAVIHKPSEKNISDNE
jgi:hypothetical protein